MSKKLGVTIGFLSGLGFFLGWYSLTYMMMFTVVILLVAGEEEILKKNVLNALFLSLIFYVIIEVSFKISTGYADFLRNIVNSDAEIFDNFTFDSTGYKVLSKLNIATYVMNIAKFVKLVLAIVFGIIALKGKEVKVPLCNTFATKAIGLGSKAAKSDTTNNEATLKEIPKDI